MHSFKIALISPKGPLYRHRTGIFRKDLRAAPLTLTTLAALVPNTLGAEVKIYDEGIEDLPANIDADLIGMTVITGSAPRSYELAEKFRNQGKTVILGGPHVTLLAEEAKKHADSIVTGYAEESWPELLYDFQNQNLKKHYVMSASFSLEKKENLPFPKRELLRQKSYKTLNTFEATRGCIHNCEFCVVPVAWGRRPFQKPIEHIVEDIKQRKAKQVLFYDLNLIADKEYAKELFKALIPLKIYWVGLSTTLIGRDDELFELLVRSGCKGLLIGFESISKTTLRSTKKSFNDPDGYSELIRKLRNVGIIINGTFVFGNDDDDISTFDAVRDFVIENKIGLPRFSILTPFPGTPLFQRLEKENRIIDRDWSKYDGQHIVFQPKQMTPDQLQFGHERVWKEVYSIKGIGKRAIGNFTSIFPIVLAANSAYRYYANNLSKFYTCRGGIV
ncbi:B12-binding domain-containing radical SAM protein [Leptospira brenneri]|uniref:Radical SAM protein n=1 Tax=Leptospira brenneri TaxID=2023182 RepID=A0A2M9XX82_9LEPT|nr:radical SAM protein [Leptospira brenneri]PJZ43868.1 B12-binding domain-containing radical SAM protein [Leptospira brenneri]TGK92411.1 radical SAM protein [Leptospira brenneri]